MLDASRRVKMKSKIEEQTETAETVEMPAEKIEKINMHKEKLEKRISIDEYFSKMARLAAERSICVTRHRIGAVVVKNKQVISTGYNGPPRGWDHCADGCVKDLKDIKSGEGQYECPAVHAEMNALIQAGRLADGSTIYTSGYPCRICARMIVNAGIVRVVTSGSYTDKEGLAILKKTGVQIEHIEIK